jgi:predicted RNA binding protein YcfA (HicA-like mRNA interferase family)
LPKIVPIDYRTLVKVFELDGFTIQRQKGDHIVLTKPGVKRPLVIQSSKGSRDSHPHEYDHRRDEPRTIF